MAVGNFQVVVGLGNGTVRRFYRDNSTIGGPGGTGTFETAPWIGPADASGFNADPASSISLIRSSFGNLEVIVLTPGARLTHYYQDYRDPAGKWSFGGRLPEAGDPLDGLDEIVGSPSFIQQPSLSGSPGNFEVLAPRIDGTVVHYTRHNDQPGYPWTIQDAFGPLKGGFANVWYVTLIQSDYNDTPLQHDQLISDTPGNLECIVVKGDDSSLWHFYREASSGRWYNSTYPRPITSAAGNGVADGRLAHPGARGAPGMSGGDIRSYLGLGSSNGWHSNFEVVVPTPFDTLAHYYRDNQNGQKWYATEEFGAGSYVTLLQDWELQSLEVIASGDAAGLQHYRRDAGGGNWAFTRSFAPSNGAGGAGFALDPIILPPT